MSESRTIERAYRLRCYPTRRQRAVLARLFGASRYVWNWALARRTEAYRSDKTTLNWAALSREFTALRAAAQTAWLAELPREPFNQVLRDLERAFGHFFARRARYPRFRRRGGKASVRFTLDQRREQVNRGEGTERWAQVELPGLGRLKLRRTAALEGRLRSVTLSRDGAGRYFAAITADRVAAPEPVGARVAAVGVDVGLRDLLVVHDGDRARFVPAPKALAGKLVRLRRYQRRQSRQLAAQMRIQGLDPTRPCPKGVRLGMSRRRQRTRERIARLQARVRDQRRNTLHEASAAVVGQAQVICLEALRVKAMARGMGRRSFRRSVADAALGEVRRQITYKGAWQQRQVVLVDTFFPSSKTCSGCGAVNAALRLEKRWRCPSCGTEHDRDVNAAKNLRAEGLRILAGSSPATAKRAGSDARGVACAADAVQRGNRCTASAPPHDEPRTGQKARAGCTARTGRDSACAVRNSALHGQGRTLNV